MSSPKVPLPEDIWPVMSLSLELRTRRFEMTSLVFWTIALISAVCWLFNSASLVRGFCPAPPREISM